MEVCCNQRGGCGHRVHCGCERKDSLWMWPKDSWSCMDNVWRVFCESRGEKQVCTRWNICREMTWIHKRDNEYGNVACMIICHDILQYLTTLQYTNRHARLCTGSFMFTCT